MSEQSQKTHLTESEVVEKITAMYQEKMKPNQKLNYVIFKGKNMLNDRIGLPVEIQYTHTAGTGRVTEKKEEIYFYPIFDPFTGERITENNEG